MVIFVTSKAAFKEMLPEIKSGEHSIWLLSNILSEPEIAGLSSVIRDINIFDYTFESGDIDFFQEALTTIEQHHPNATIWVERQYQKD